MLKNWCFWTVVLEKTLESPLDSKEIKPVNCKGNQLWIFTGRTDTEAPILGHLMWRADSLEKILMLGMRAGAPLPDRQTEDEMSRWYHRLNGREFEKTLGDSEGQRSLACCRPWVAKSQTWLSNWTTTTGLNKKSIILLLLTDGETEYRDIERLVQSGYGITIPIQAVWSQSPGS